MSIEERLKKIMAEILKVGQDQIKEDTAIGDLGAWDSLNHLRIISAAEKEFGIQFTPDVLMDLEDFSDIAAAVRNALA